MTEPGPGIRQRPVYFPTLANNDHLAKLQAYFGQLGGPIDRDVGDTRYVFICYSNRSGSNYLADLLSSSRVYNLAGEDLNFDTVIDHCTRQGLSSFNDYFNFLIRLKRQSNLLFLKVAPAHLELLGRSGLLDDIISRCSFVQIERADKLGQAISLAIASATGRYTSQMTGTKPATEVVFSATQLSTIIRNLAQTHLQFDLFYAHNGITPINILYETLADAGPSAAEHLAQQLGLPDFTVKTANLRLTRQADDLSLAWRRRYLETPLEE